MPCDSVFDAWSEFIVGILKSESDLTASIASHGGEIVNAREALIKGVLSRILPSAYEIGTGEMPNQMRQDRRTGKCRKFINYWTK